MNISSTSTSLFQALSWNFSNDCLIVCGKTLNNNFVFYKIINFTLAIYIGGLNNFNNNEIKDLRLVILKKGAVQTKWVIKIPFENSIVLNDEGEVYRKKVRVLRIEFSSLQAFYSVRKMLQGMDLILYNDKIKPIVQFFAEQPNFKPCGWYQLEPTLKNIKQKNILQNGITVGVDKESRTNLFLQAQPDIELQAPLRICSYDLETRGTNEKIHQIYQVGMVWETFFHTSKDPEIKRVLINNGPCLPITDPLTEVVICHSEKELLIKFILYLKKNPIDFLIGYNIYKFDNVFIKTRCEIHGISSYLLQLHRTDSSSQNLKNFFVEKSSGKGEKYNTILDFRIQGTTCIDLMPMSIKEDRNTLKSYSLNAVSEKYLGEKKIDLNYKEMERLVVEGEAKGFWKIGVYCIQDCALPLKLLEKMNILLYQINYSNLSSFPLDMIFSFGEQAKIYSIIYVDGIKNDFIFKANIPIEGGFQGATVLDPIPGYYYSVMCLDFKSLYPTIIISNRLCPSTLIKPNNMELLQKAIEKNNVNVIKADDGKIIYVAKYLNCLIPSILEKLLAARDELKKQMKTHPKNSFGHKLLDAKQQAMKVSANTTYGVFGAGFGELQCLDLSRATTALGRKMIKTTVNYCHTIGREKYGELKVIYGDSVPKWSLVSLLHESTFKPSPITCEALWKFIEQKRQEVLFDNLQPQQFLNQPYSKVEPLVNSEKKEIFFCKDLGLYTWSDAGKTQIHAIIRHKPRVQKMFRIVTRGGIIEVTPDHSILQRVIINGESIIKVVKPSMLKVGDKLISKKFEF